MTDDTTRDAAWSKPPDQHETAPTERKIGEGMLSDGPNGQNSTPPVASVRNVSAGTTPEDEALETE